jgi:16S rRNA (adenine1518-N6/adenine1519-N6)-dimethyltransferase
VTKNPGYPKKSLGQNFLSDPVILGNIVESAGITSGDTIVEIGPGPGIMTKMLAKAAKRVIAIELDAGLHARLEAETAGLQNLELVLADAMKFDYESIGPFKVVANIPYYITTPLIFRLLEARKNLISMTLTIQKEVARRIVAGPGTKDYGVLSIGVQYYAEPELKFVIPARIFRPVPKVDSATIHMAIRGTPAVSVKDEALFFRLIRAGFSQRRKTLSNSLKPLFSDIKAILEAVGIDSGRRAETLSMEEFARLADYIGPRQSPE